MTWTSDTEVCGGVIKQESGIIKSPSQSLKYLQKKITESLVRT